MRMMRPFGVSVPTSMKASDANPLRTLPKIFRLPLLGAVFVLLVLGFSRALAVPPTISVITDRFVTEDTPGEPIPFTVNDAETPAASLRVASVSSNTQLVPSGNVIISGTGAERFLTIIPATNEVGVTLITVSVLDGENLAASTSFQFKVFNLNDPPTIVVTNKAVRAEAGTLVSVPFKVQDPDGVSNLVLIGFSSNFAAVSDTSIFFGGSGSDRLVILNLPATAVGTSRITLSVADPQGLNASDFFDLTVTGPQTKPPVIVTQPTDVAVASGSPASFSVVATGQGVLTYQWQFRGANIPGATSAVLNIPIVSPLNAGEYRVTVSNSAGSVTSLASTLSVQTPPAILVQPQSQTLVVGTPLLLSVEAAGVPPLGYQWAFNGTNLPGASSPFFQIPAVESTNAGSYFVVVNSSSGSVTSSVAVITVAPRANLSPIVSMSSPLNGTRFFAPKSIKLSANASDLDGQVAKVEFYAGPSLLGSAQSAPFSLVVSNLPPGTYSIVAVATDNRGATTTSSGVTMTGVSTGPTTPGQPNSAFNPYIGPNGPVLAAVPDGQGGWFVAGGFSTYDDVSRGRVARIRSDGSLDAGFNPSAGANNSVFALALQADGKLLLAGAFDRVSGVSRPGLARLMPDGSLDSSFAIGAGGNNAVYAIALQSDGKVVVGGAFTQFSGQRRNGLTRLNTDGSLDFGFDNLGIGGGLVTRVSALAIDAGGNIVAAGDFTEAGGIPRNRVARFKSNGTLDAGFDPGAGPDQAVNAMSLGKDGSVFVAGAFGQVQGQARGGVARLMMSGALDPLFNPGAGTDAAINAVAVQADGRVIVAGGFTKAFGQSRAGVARLTAQGQLDPSFDVGSGIAGGFVPRANALARTQDGSILVGGDFRQANGFNYAYVVRLHGEADATTGGGGDSAKFLGLVASGGFVELTLEGKAGRSYILQASPDLVSWISLKTNTAPADHFVVTDFAGGIPARFYRVLNR